MPETARSKAMFGRMALIGCGLMGGSFALAARQAGVVDTIVGYSLSAESSQRARECGAIDQAVESAQQAAAQADLVVLAVPVKATQSSLQAVAPALTDSTLIIDLGSTKQNVIEAARVALGDHFRNFVACHPITGREVSGIEHADALLYRDQQVILTPTDETRLKKIEQARSLWQALGSHVATLTAQSHDEALAAVSHLPHLIAYAFMDSITNQPQGREFLALAGPGFRDFSRIAASDPKIWSDILTSNRNELLGQLQHFQAALTHVQKLVADGDGNALAQLILRASHSRATWRIGHGLG